MVTERFAAAGLLSNGLVDEAKLEIDRMMQALKPFVQRGIPIVGLEPSCLLTLRDEYLALYPGPEAEQLAENSFMLEEFLARELDAGKLDLKLQAWEQSGHCFMVIVIKKHLLCSHLFRGSSS